AVGALPDGTEVIVSGGADGTVRVWRLADGTPVGGPLLTMIGALPDGTEGIVRGPYDGTARGGRGAGRPPARGRPAPPGGARRTRWRWGRCRTARRSSSAAAMTARCGGGGWPTAPRSGSRCATSPSRMTPRYTSSAAATMARCGGGGWPTSPRSRSHYPGQL